MTTNLKFTALLCAVALSACGDDASRELIAPPPPGTQIKFFNFGINAPGVNFYANTTKMTAIGSATGAESTTGTTYGNAGAGGVYTAITPGTYDLAGKIAAATDKDLAISHVNTTLEQGKRYSFYQSGFYNTTTKAVDAFVIEDAWTVPTDTMVAVRFVNTSPNAGSIPLTVKSQDTGSSTIAIGAAQPYKGATTFVKVPPGFYDITVSGIQGTTPFTLTRTGVSFSAYHVYTVTLRGDWTVTSTTATNRPTLDVTANY